METIDFNKVLTDNIGVVEELMDLKNMKSFRILLRPETIFEFDASGNGLLLLGSVNHGTTAVVSRGSTSERSLIISNVYNLVSLSNTPRQIEVRLSSKSISLINHFEENKDLWVRYISCE